jgi:hypothetical protein
MAPVTFYRESAHPIEPYYISPWQEEGRELGGDVLDSLRGDFFCLPFVWPSEEAGVSYAPHGDPPGSDWSEPVVESHGAVTSLMSEVPTEKPKGSVIKRINLVDGENVLYVSHELEGYDVRTPIGHHAVLDCFPGAPALWTTCSSSPPKTTFSPGPRPRPRGGVRSAGPGLCGVEKRELSQSSRRAGSIL